jgi:NitT/TauT family transport system substrate-binding protein
MNAAALAKLGYIPSVSRAESSVTTAANEMIAAGMLAPNTNVAELAKRAFAHLDGVTDEWIDKAEVKTVANGQIIPIVSRTVAAAAARAKEMAGCCAMSAATN